MNNVDTLFATVFSLAFAPVLVMYVYGMYTNLIDRPSRHNTSMLVPPVMLLICGALAGLCGLAFYNTGLPKAGITCFAIITLWCVCTISLVSTARPQLTR